MRKKKKCFHPEEKVSGHDNKGGQEEGIMPPHDCTKHSRGASESVKGLEVSM